MSVKPEEEQAREDLKELLEQTSYFLQNIEDVVKTTDDESSMLMWAEVYQATVQVRTALRKAEQEIEKRYAMDLQHLWMDVTPVKA